MSKLHSFLTLTAGLFLFAAAAQQPPAAAKPRRVPVEPLVESGFRPIFNGSSLDGWDGDPTFWRAQDGTIIGETTVEKPTKANTFLIWRGGSPADFEIRLDFRLTGHNSGLQVRSVQLPDLPWVMKGYQCDIDAAQTYTGQFYEERGRGFLALRGQATYIPNGGKPGMVASLGASDELKALIKSDDWNQLHVIARGNTLLQIINGRVMSALVDDDIPNRKLDGLLGFQVHAGPPMKIEVRNVRLKTF